MAIIQKAIDVLRKSRVQIGPLQANVQHRRCGLNSSGRPTPRLGLLVLRLRLVGDLRVARSGRYPKERKITISRIEALLDN
jgi:hypothetical protein